MKDNTFNLVLKVLKKFFGYVLGLVVGFVILALINGLGDKSLIKAGFIPIATMIIGISFYELMKLITNLESIAKRDEDLNHWIEAPGATSDFEDVLSNLGPTKIEKDNIAAIRDKLVKYCNNDLETMKNLTYYYEAQYSRADNPIIKTALSIFVVVGAFIINSLFTNQGNVINAGNSFNLLAMVLLVAGLIAYIYRDLYKKPKLGFIIIKILNDEINKKTI